MFKLNNKYISAMVFRTIHKNGWTPINVWYSTDFTTSNFGEVEFEIKELPKWKFGMWINLNDREDDNALSFFGQHKETINKFTPSCSYFCDRYRWAELQELDDTYSFSVIITMLSHIKHNPISSYVQSYWEYSKFTDESFPIEAMRIKKMYATKRVKQKINDTIPLYHFIKIPMINAEDIVGKVTVIDRGEYSSPRYDLQITFSTLYDDEDKQNEEECRILRKYFKKNLWEYENISIELFRNAENTFYTYELYDKR